MEPEFGSSGINQSMRTRRRHAALTAAIIGLGAVVASGVVGFVAYRVSQRTLLVAIADGNLALAKSFANHVDHDYHAGVPKSTDRAQVLSRIAESWDTTEVIHEGSYLCVVGSDNTLAFHSKRSDLEGKVVGDVVCDDGEPPLTVAMLIEQRRNWAGENLNARGEPQLAGYAYSEALGGLVVVHLPKRLIEGRVLTAILPWLIGFALMTTVLIPLALGLLHTSYRRAERARATAAIALRESEERLKLALDGTELGVWDRDLIDGAVYVNERWAAMVGYTLAEVEPHLRDWGLVHPDDLPDVKAAFDAHLQGLTPTYATQHRLRTKFGDWKWVLDQGKVVQRDAWGRPLRATGTHRDIDARRRAELDSAANRREFERLADSSPSLVFRVDRDGHCVYANRRWQEMTGRPDGMWSGTGWGDAVHPADRERVRSVWRRSARTRTASRCEHRFLHRNGRSVWVLTLATPCFGEDGELESFIGTCTDISELKRTESALRDSEERLRQRQRIERLLFAELDHRVRNNLSSLVALIDLTQRRSDDVGTFADTVRSRVLAMATVHGLLTSSRRLTTSLRALVLALLPEGHQADVDFHGEEIEVNAGQATALAMVLHELIMNSTKYGALGAERGSINVAWDIDRLTGESARVDLRWREIGGPIIEMKPTPGVGTSLIHGLVRTDLRGDVTLSYAPTGADHRFRLELEAKNDMSLV